MTLTREQIADFVIQGYLDARANERAKASQIRYEVEQEIRLKNLTERLYTRTYKMSSPIAFIIHKPTVREVFAPKFQDRIVSHVLFNMVAPLFERTFVFDSYSCRKGKGTLLAIDRFEHFHRAATNNETEEAYVLNIDISGYFMNINKGILYAIICRTFAKYRYRNISKTDHRKWDDVIDFSFADYLVRQQLFRNPAEMCVRVGKLSDWDFLPKHKSLFYSPLGTGLTIGDLCSQLFSNIYMNEYDQFVKRVLKAKYYGRYVDDARILSTDKEYLLWCKEESRKFLENKLALKLHPTKTRITSTRNSNEFLGAVFKPHRRYPARRAIAAFRRSVNYWEYMLTSGQPIDTGRMLCIINSYLGHFRYFKCFKALNSTLEHSPLKKILIFARNYSKATLIK